MRVVPDDKATGYAFLLGILGLCLCVGLVLFWLFFFGQPPGSALVQREDVFCTEVLLVATISAIVSWQRWQQINRRRQAAASGIPGVAALATIHPSPNGAALALRAVIVHKKSRLRELALFVVLWVGISGMLTLMDTFLFRGGGWAGFLAEIQTNLLSSGGATVVGCLVSLLHSPYTQLEIYAGRLALSTPTKKKTVRWDEALLFAVRGPRTALSKAITYELASAKEVVTWKPLRRLHWWSIERPIVPFEEYQGQMEALLSLIAARTHLPLYDVRQPSAE